MPVDKGDRGEKPKAKQKQATEPYAGGGFKTADLTPPKKKPKPKPKPKPDTGFRQATIPPAPVSEPGAVKTATEPTPPTPSAPPAAPPAPKFEPPHPTLQKYGFNQGGIETFNHRTQSVVDSYTRAYGVKPSPGLVFDLARSKVDEQDFDHLFTVPQSQFASQNRGFTNKATGQGEHMLVRPDGLHVAPNPPGLPAANTLTDLHKQFPTVEMGVFPIPGGDKLIGALKDLGSIKGDLQVTMNDQTLHQAQRLAEGRGIPLEEAKTMLRTAAVSKARGSVQTIQQAQQELNKAMGTTLPVTGTFNPDWLKAISNWMKSKDYFVRAAKFQADQAGYKDYASYLKAWKAKQVAVSKHGAFQFFLGALPLHAFDDGSSPLEVLKDTVTQPFANPAFGPSYPLHLLTRTASTTLDVVGGTVAQSKAYMAAGNAFTLAVLPKGVPSPIVTGEVGKGETLDQAKARAKHALLQNPSWMRVFYPDLPDKKDQPEWLKTLDATTNLAGDIILLRKPSFTGEQVFAGSVSAARTSPYLQRAGAYAFRYLQDGKIGRAAALLEGGQGSERFVAHAAKLVKTGRMSQEEFTDHLAELYATGKTTVGPKEVEGPTLSSLRTGRLPTKRKATMAVQQLARDATDEFQKGVSTHGRVGTLANDFTAFLRSEFSHAVPRSASRGFFDPKLPERVHDFVFRFTKDAELANKFESELVRARATENISRIAKINEQLQKLYHEARPVGDSKPVEIDPFNAQLESEAASRFYFPGGNSKSITSNPFTIIAGNAARVTAFLNRASAYHRLVILSGFPVNLVPGVGRVAAGRSLFFKHMFGDTTRRIVGGDEIFGSGTNQAIGDIGRLVETDPALARKWGSYLDRSTYSETRYLSGGREETASFKTSERFKDKPFMKGAGAYLRRMLDDNALMAYRASTPNDVTPLVEMVLKNDRVRKMWKAAQRKAAVQAFGEQTVKTKGISLTHFNDILPAEDFATQIFNRYREVEEAAQTAGTSLDDALGVLRKYRGGKSDAALGDWIKGNKVDFHVSNAQVQTGSTFDQSMSKTIERIMVFNKWNRGGMAKNVAASMYASLRKAGWDEHAALETAMDVGERQTTYHMLDFANMLQAEQDLRWLSYFATKHRLYWKWVVSTFVRTPMSAAIVDDARQHLDDKGNLNFDLFGYKLAVPAARLFWVPGREYSEVAPTAQATLAFLRSRGSVQAAVNATAGTFGNVLTRSDTGIHLLGTAAAIQAGKIPATYQAATNNLEPSTQARVNREINHFQQDYLAEHGHYAPPREAILHALWKTGAEEMWRANLPLPVLPQASDRNETQALLDKFMRIVDPQKRGKFLDDHPELAIQFGVSKDPGDYLHTRTYWSQYTQALDLYHAARQHIYEQAKKTGVMTAELDKERRQASQEFSRIFEKLKTHDRLSTPVGRQREVNGELLGIWGQQVSADPLVDPKNAVPALLGQLGIKVDQKKLAAALPGQLVKNAQLELRLLSDPKYIQKTFTDPSDAKSRRRQLLQFLDDFKSFPHDALAKLTTAYVQKHVNPFWKHVTDSQATINTLGRGDKDLAYAELRVWKDEQDKPVVIDGVRFPSPVAAAWQNLPPDEFKQRIAGMASGSWDHLADYEKRLLGHPAPKDASKGWRDYLETVKDYHSQYPGARLAKNQVTYLVKALGRRYPGFNRDYLFSQKPHVDRLEATDVYREMPAEARHSWDVEIGSNAKTIANAYASGNYKSAELQHTWEVYVKTDIPKYLEEHPALKRWVQPFVDANPDFFNTLPVK